MAVTDTFTTTSLLDFATGYKVTEANFDALVSNLEWLKNRVPKSNRATGVLATRSANTYADSGLSLTLTLPSTAIPTRTYTIIAHAFGSFTGTGGRMGIVIGGAAIQEGPSIPSSSYLCSARVTGQTGSVVVKTQLKGDGSNTMTHAADIVLVAEAFCEV